MSGAFVVVPIEILFGTGSPGGLEVSLGFVVEIKLGCAHTECVDVYGAMPVAALQVAVVQGLEERPALVEEVFNLLPLSLGVGFWGW